MINMNNNEKEYLKILQELVDLSDTDESLKNRTDVKAYKVFGRSMTFDLSDNKIPLLTTKKINPTNIFHELLWMFILKNPDTSYLDENGVNIWNQWKVPLGDSFTIGEMYGQVLRNFKDEFDQKNSLFNTDQLAKTIDLLKTTPQTRRAVFSLFDPRAVADESKSFKTNVEEGRGVLNNCHGMVNQFDINSDGDLEFITYQRSADVFLGIPYNIVFYSTFCHMVAQVLGLKCTKMIYHLGNTHLYENCLEQAKIQLSRDGYPDPILSLNPDIKDFDSFRIQDLKVSGYRHHGFLKAPVAV